MKKITDYLQELGLTEIEAKVYQGLCEIGSTTVKNLSDHIGIKRITTHFNVENLITKGLIAQTVHGSRRQIIAEPPERLEYLIEQKEKNIARLKVDFPDFVKTLQLDLSKPKSHEQTVEVKYYTGKKEVQLIYNEVLTSAKEVRSYVKMDAVSEVFPENFELFSKKMKENPNLIMWEIVEKSKVAKESTDVFARNERYHFKIAHTSIRLSASDVMIYNNKVAMVNLSQHVSGVIIESKDFYEISKEIFDFVWRMTPELT
jgi:sugar-specific transcriptional regulator TrmB